MNQIYKPYQNSLHYTEFEYLRYHGKLKNFCFIVAKTPNNQQGFEDKDPSFVFPHIQWNYAKLKSEKFQGKIGKNCMFLTTKANVCTLIYEVDMIFTADADVNQRIVAEYLKNFRNLHKLVVPLYHLKEDSSANTSPSSLNKKKIGNTITNSNNYNYTNYVNLANNINNSSNTPKKEERKSNLLAPLYEIPKKTFSEASSNVLKKKKFNFNKGHADSYANAENMKIFYEYFKSFSHVFDSITNKYMIGPLPPSNKFIESTETQGHFAYKKDYSRGKNGGLHYHNTELMAEQKKVILSLLKQAGSNLIHGRSIMNVSLPLEVFEPRSFLERLARSFGHAPVFLEKAGALANVVEQMKYTVSFFLSSIVLCIQQEKPFNPILGETFQGRINGFPIYMEQVSHHPAITYYLMKGKNYWFCGSHEAVANLGANTLAAEQKGTPMVRFPINNTSIYFKWPMFVIHGAAVGTRYLNFYSKAFAFEKTHGLLCEIVFNVNEIGGFSGLFQKKESYSIDEIGGAIYKVRPEIIEKVHTAKKHQKINIDPNDIVETIAKIKGEWTSYVEFDGKRYWDIEREKPYLLEYEENPLPSDCNYRDDVILMRMGNRPAAQIKKNEGETSQRYDKKLRENYQKSLKKIKKHK